MREFIGLYRGKRKDNGEWVEGYYAGFDLICPREPEDTLNATGDYYGETPYVGFVDVDPDTVGECTGLRDKKGKLIFEGDIVCFKWDKELEYCFVIKFEDGEFCAMPDPSLKGVWPIRISGYNGKFKIRSNIHDNPELLKGGEQ